jgi:uncharacterized protein YndB with AHSA1/START domain
MAEIKPIAPYLEPLRRAVTVRRTPAEAFEIFTARLADWWPYTKFSLHLEETATCAIEPRVGGEIYEVSKAGERAVWGTVLAWEPPARMVMTWHPGRPPDTAQEVEMRFVAVAEGTRVELEHRGWAALGAEAEESRQSYEGGWAFVFEVRFVEACA